MGAFRDFASGFTSGLVAPTPRVRIIPDAGPEVMALSESDHRDTSGWTGTVPRHLDHYRLYTQIAVRGLEARARVAVRRSRYNLIVDKLSRRHGGRPDLRLVRSYLAGPITGASDAALEAVWWQMWAEIDAGAKHITAEELRLASVEATYGEDEAARVAVLLKGRR